MCYDCRYEEKHCIHVNLRRYERGWWECQFCFRKFRLAKPRKGGEQRAKTIRVRNAASR